MSLNDTFRNYAIGAVAGVALFSAVLSGQTRSVNGRVLDSENMLPLDSAKVVLVNENTHKSLDSLLTTTNGNYQFYFIPTDVLTTPTLPVKPKLYPNYPNPFNPSTTIRYELPKNEDVNLRIVNILGQEIFKQEYFLQAGTHEWNVEGLGASGVYIYQVSTKDHSEAKKMVLLDGGSGNVNVRLKESASTLMPLSKVQTDQYSVNAAKRHFYPQSKIVPDQENSLIDFLMAYVPDTMNVSGVARNKNTSAPLDSTTISFIALPSTDLGNTTTNSTGNYGKTLTGRLEGKNIDVHATRNNYFDWDSTITYSRNATVNFSMQSKTPTHNYNFVLHVYDGIGNNRNGFNVILTTQPNGHVHNVPISNGTATFNISNELDTLAVLTQTNPDLLKWSVVMPDTNNYFGVDNLAQSVDRNTSPTVNLKALRPSNDVYFIEKYVPHPQKAGEQIAMDSIEAVTIINGQDNQIAKFVPYQGLNQIDNVIFSWYFPTGQPIDSVTFNRALTALNTVQQGFILSGNNKKLLDLKPLVKVDSLADPYWQSIKNRGFENVVYTEFDIGPANHESIRIDWTIKYGYASYYGASDGQMRAEEYQKLTHNADYKGGTGGYIFGIFMPNYSKFGQNCTLIMQLVKPGSNY